MRKLNEPGLSALRLIPAPMRLDTHNGKPCWRHWLLALYVSRPA
jgi:hypothetical protein